jgi:hypothetical protein
LTVSKNLQLVAKSHHLELQVDASPQAGKKTVNDGNDGLAHDTDATGRHLEKPGFLRRTEFMGGAPNIHARSVVIRGIPVKLQEINQDRDVRRLLGATNGSFRSRNGGSRQAMRIAAARSNQEPVTAPSGKATSQPW